MQEEEEEEFTRRTSMEEEEFTRLCEQASKQTGVTITDKARKLIYAALVGVDDRPAPRFLSQMRDDLDAAYVKRLLIAACDELPGAAEARLSAPYAFHWMESWTRRYGRFFSGPKL